MTFNNNSIICSMIVDEYFFNEEFSLPASLSSILSKYVDKSPFFCVTNVIKVQIGPTYLFCSISTPEEKDIRAWELYKRKPY